MNDEDEEDGWRGGYLLPPPVKEVGDKSVKIFGRVLDGTDTLLTLSEGGLFGKTLVEGGLLGTAMHGIGTALGTVSLVTLPVGIALALTEVAFSVRSIAKTYSHIAKLKEIKKKHYRNELVGTRETIEYVLHQKNKKLKHKGVGCIPGVGSLVNSVYMVGRAIQKKAQNSKGKDRKENAKTLWTNLLDGCEMAEAACKELLGEKMYQKLMNLPQEDRQLGWMVLKKKMKSI
jgi:hypothetical protein